LPIGKLAIRIPKPSTHYTLGVRLNSFVVARYVALAGASSKRRDKRRRAATLGSGDSPTPPTRFSGERGTKTDGTISTQPASLAFQPILTAPSPNPSTARRIDRSCCAQSSSGTRPSVHPANQRAWHRGHDKRALWLLIFRHGRSLPPPRARAPAWPVERQRPQEQGSEKGSYRRSSSCFLMTK
jgi:hypothetical protein